MVDIRLKILDKGHIVQEQLIRVLQRHEDAIASNTSGDSAIAEVVGDEDGGLVKDVATLKETVGDSTGGLVKTVSELSNYDDSDLKLYISEILTENNLTDPRAESEPPTQGDG